MATKREEAIAMLAARYGGNNFYDPYRDGSPATQSATRAIEEVNWAERIGRLNHLHQSLTRGVNLSESAVAEADA